MKKIQVQYIESEYNILVFTEPSLRAYDEVDEDIADWYPQDDYDSDFTYPHLDDERINDL